MYYTYMLRCKDESIYTGITTDIHRRMREHFEKDAKCAKYTFTHTAKKIEAIWKTENRVLASKLEYQIKKLKKEYKEEIIKESIGLEKYLSQKIECERYNRLRKNEINEVITSFVQDKN